MQDRAILEVACLGFPWPTIDPFLFCAHHDDAYPAGNERFGPAASLAGRNLGRDFTRRGLAVLAPGGRRTVKSS